jgi:Tol biopolymer transport system component
MLELKWVAEGGSAAGLPAPVVAKRKNRQRLGMAAAGVLLLTLGLIAGRTLRAPVRDARALRLSLSPPANAPFESFRSVTVSPDGQRIAFVGEAPDGKGSLWVRALDAVQPRLLPGTEGAFHPFWSPDSRFLGFFADGKLKRIDASGGPPQILTKALFGFGGTWNRDGTILFAPNVLESLYKVPASGGTPVAVTRLAPREEAHRWPCFLPDGRHFVFLADARRTEDHHLKIGSLDSPETREIANAVSSVAFAEPGYLLFVRAGSLLAQSFDEKRLRLEGEPLVVGEKIAEDGNTNHKFEFSVSRTGVLAYRSADPGSQLTWFDRSGHPAGKVGDPTRRGYLALSPARNQLAYEQLDADGRHADLWLIDLSRAVTSRFTFDPGSNFSPVWSPDGNRIVYGATRKEFEDLYVRSAVAGAQEELLLASGDDKAPTSWSSDGRYILFEDYTSDRGIDVMLLSLDGAPKAEPFVQTPFDEQRATFSPDGRWVAYVSGESGRDEVYVTSFPARTNRRQVSTGGGGRPQWRADGRELFYGARGGKLLSVDVGPNGDFGPPKEILQVRGARDYAVAPDGQRFLVDVALEDPGVAPATIVVNWTADLKK